jgi:hypothetical protein
VQQLLAYDAGPLAVGGQEDRLRQVQSRLEPCRVCWSVDASIIALRICDCKRYEVAAERRAVEPSNAREVLQRLCRRTARPKLSAAGHVLRSRACDAHGTGQRVLRNCSERREDGVRLGEELPERHEHGRQRCAPFVRLTAMDSSAAQLPAKTPASSGACTGALGAGAGGRLDVDAAAAGIVEAWRELGGCGGQEET